MASQQPNSAIDSAWGRRMAVFGHTITLYASARRRLDRDHKAEARNITDATIQEAMADIHHPPGIPLTPRRFLTMSRARLAVRRTPARKAAFVLCWVFVVLPRFLYGWVRTGAKVLFWGMVAVGRRIRAWKAAGRRLEGVKEHIRFVARTQLRVRMRYTGLFVWKIQVVTAFCEILGLF